MSFEQVAEARRQARLLRGWSILALVLASWGVVAIVGLAIWGMVQIEWALLTFIAIFVAAAVAFALWAAWRIRRLIAFLFAIGEMTDDH